MSRWSNWTVGLERKRYFQDVLKEAGQPMQGDPQEIAQQNGWTSKGYGWYQDAQGQVVARSLDGTMYYYETPPNEVDKQVDTGNPTSAASGMKPADRARSMGLQSNGRGGYVDPQSGQVVARTVNNELVFYDSRPGGGAVSDGAGGQAMANNTPSWQDPVTGLVVTPPAKPESAQEIAAIPDPIPAQSPSGYNKFIQQKKLYAYAQHKKEYEERQQNEQNAEAINQAMAPYQETPDMKQWADDFQSRLMQAIESGDPARVENAEKALQLATREAQNNGGLFGTALGLARDDSNTGNANEDVAMLQKAFLGQIMTQAKGDMQKSRAFYRQIQQYVDTRNPQYQEFWNNDDPDPQIQSIQGDRVVYNLTTKPEHETFAPDDMPIVFDMANEVGEQYGVQPTDVTEVEWESEETEDDDENRLTALDALKTWRQKVLPSLMPGQVLFNVPLKGGRDDNQRERIYRMAGFGPADAVGDSNVQWGMVVTDENGNNRVVPIGEEPNRVNESYMAFFDMNLNTNHMNTLYEHIFDGLRPVEAAITGEPQG